MAEKIPPLWRLERSGSSENLNEENEEAPISNPPGGLFTRTTEGGINYAYEASPDDEDDHPPPSRHSHSRDSLRPDVERVPRPNDGINYGYEASDEDYIPTSRHSNSKDSLRPDVDVRRGHSRFEANPRADPRAVSRNPVTNDNHEAAEVYLPPSRLSHSRDSLRLDVEDRQFSSREANARAHFMAVTRPPMYQRSISDGFYCERASPDKETYILMSPLSSTNRQAASNPFIDETSRDIENAEARMVGATGGDVNAGEIPPRRELAPNRYEASRISDQRTSLQTLAPGSRDNVDTSNSVRSSTLSNATTVSDQQRRNRGTITPFLDEYYRTRTTAFVTDNPPPSDQVNLVDNEVQEDNQIPQENPQEQGAAVPQEDGCFGSYYRFASRISSSPFMVLIYFPLTFWGFYCIFEGLKYMKYCPSTDTLPMIFVFLGLTASFACIARMFHFIMHRSTVYPLISNIVKCLQSVMFLGYFFIYILELSSFLLLDFQRLTEVCAVEYFNFSHWNTWFQLLVLAIMILLHIPAASRYKWCCGTTERS